MLFSTSVAIFGNYSQKLRYTLLTVNVADLLSSLQEAIDNIYITEGNVWKASTGLYRFENIV